MSSDGLKVDLRDGVLVLTLAHPPFNDLSPHIRSALVQAIVERGEDCRGIVIAADGPNFSGQVLIVADTESPSLAELCQVVANCPVPVVAVLRGLAVGSGAELALAARARLAEPSMRMAFADLSLGLCPGAGATRRLPRLIGAAAALDLLLTARQVPAAEAMALGLVDGITESASIASAMRLAAALAVTDMLQRPDPDPAAWQAAVAEARKHPEARTTAGRRIIDCVEAALVLPEAAAQAFETTARRDLEQTEESIGLRAAATAERRALALPAVLTRLRTLSVDRVGLVGTAPDLARVAVVALSRQLGVTWSVPNSAARKVGLAVVEAGIKEGLRGGRLDPDRARAMRDRLQLVEGPLAEGSLPFLISDSSAQEAPELPPGAARLVLGGQDGEMGLALSLTGRVCEVSLPPDTMPLARATALSGLRRMGLAPVQVGSRPMIGARMSDASRTALAWMVAQGVPRRQIAAVMEQFGISTPDPVSIEAPTVLRAMPAAEVLNRWLAALANEGARLIEEGIARRPSDIDHLMVAGYNFPRWRGGPMHQADRRGLMVLRRDLRAWGAEVSLWSPAPLIDRLIGEGRSLASLEG